LLDADGEADWLGLEEADAEAEGFAGEAEAEGMAEADAEGIAEADAEGIAEAEGMAEAEAEGLPPMLVTISLSWA
jgi:hypothetical protein